jgi:hypothetical protein
MAECELMSDFEIEPSTKAIMRLYEEDCRTPFPYAGVRKLLQAGRHEYESFLPDLAQDFSMMAGYCSWGKKILTWDVNRICEAQQFLEKPFFERHPEYKPLEQILAKRGNDELGLKLLLHEKMRMELSQLLKYLSATETRCPTT